MLEGVFNMTKHTPFMRIVKHGGSGVMICSFSVFFSRVKLYRVKCKHVSVYVCDSLKLSSADTRHYITRERTALGPHGSTP